MHEKRGATRRRALKIGRIVFDRGESEVDCVVRDISGNGMRLLVDGASPALPDQFLVTVEAPTGRQSWACRVVRRAPSELGVAFE